MSRCTHCGERSSGAYELRFEHQSRSKEMELQLCDGCLDRIREGEDATLLE
ncbi:hypothetical protein U4E84_03160 [Halorubrum sp. AD140]|uniref:hypothetical protein n=1 Tax=Halorubrum sp. AD140 TaxID=3050073 RepID=UPI002ACC7B3C|nr:hypothetical protein [Halorubrum sp. AD140]MDZ5810352.1 hypothetical protein [Halorubrum sp. AD140]